MHNNEVVVNDKLLEKMMLRTNKRMSLTYNEQSTVLLDRISFKYNGFLKFLPFRAIRKLVINIEQAFYFASLPEQLVVLESIEIKIASDDFPSNYLQAIFRGLGQFSAAKDLAILPSEQFTTSFTYQSEIDLKLTEFTFVNLMAVFCPQCKIESLISIFPSAEQLKIGNSDIEMNSANLEYILENSQLRTLEIEQETYQYNNRKIGESKQPNYVPKSRVELQPEQSENTLTSSSIINDDELISVLLKLFLHGQMCRIANVEKIIKINETLDLLEVSGEIKQLEDLAGITYSPLAKIKDIQRTQVLDQQLLLLLGENQIVIEFSDDFLIRNIVERQSMPVLLKETISLCKVHAIEDHDRTVQLLAPYL